MRLRLPVLSVRQAPRQPGAAEGRPGRAGALHGVGGGADRRPDLRAVHPLGRGAGPLLVPPGGGRAGTAAARPPGGGPDEPRRPDPVAGLGRCRRTRQDRALVHVPPGPDTVRAVPRAVRGAGGPGDPPQRGDRRARRSPRRGAAAAGGPARGGLPLGQRRRGPHLHGRGGGPVDGDRPAVPVQPAPAPLGGAALPDRRVGDLGGRRRHGAPLPLRPRGARQSLRRQLPRGAGPPGLSARRLRLPHRLCTPGDAAAVRRLRRMGYWSAYRRCRCPRSPRSPGETENRGD